MDRSVAAPASLVRSFLIQAVFWNLALFALIRLSWVDQHLITALIAFQKTLVSWYGGPAPVGITVTSSCSGADVMALCLGVTLAYPAAWRRRLLGAAGGIILILTLNAIRIATLYSVAGKPETLNLLHIYVWPAGLTFATVLYVFFWIRWSERPTLAVSRTWTRLLVAGALGLVVYAASVPWVLTSSAVQRIGVWTATTGGALLSALGAQVTTNGPVLVTSRGAFMVTQECLFTPVLPLYLATVLALPLARRTRWMCLALTAPIFFALGVSRLLVLAVPQTIVEAPVFIAHGFYQLLAGAVLIVAAAHLAMRRRAGREASLRALAGLGIALAMAVVAGALWNGGLERALHVAHRFIPTSLATIHPQGDQQGALTLMPVFQLGLLTGLWMALTGGRARVQFGLALVGLALSQVVFLVLLGVISSRLHIAPHALVIRGWAIAAPVLVSLLWLESAGTRIGDRRYRRFWHDAGEQFPILTGAPSTDYYFENEKRLITEALPTLDGINILKTDLWDEAKNTRIMQWAADQGARVYGIDLSEPMVRQARAAFEHRTLRPAVSDVRRVPFADGSFDAIYSMGTVEHFAETTAAVAELARVLKPGGRLILGVPNRHDPFLRPLFVAAMYRIGLYGYGFEKSYSRRNLRKMLEDAGLQVDRESGILFLPGYLRMLDLFFFTRMRPLTAITSVLLKPFVWLDARFASLRRHGYLIASVGVKPQATAPHIDAAERTAHVADTGTEYVVDASGCDPALLKSLPALQRLFDEVLADLSLLPAAAPVWHVFPNPSGITGMVLLSESHLTIHTYPDEGVAAINLYCCRPRAAWPWDVGLRAHLKARDVRVRTLRRG